MKFLRQNTRLIWAFATLFVAQLFVPLALAVSRPDQGVVGIVICTSSGLKQLTQSGGLVPVGDKNSQQSGQNECLVCLTAGLNDSADVPPSTSGLAPRLHFGEQIVRPDMHSIPAGLQILGFKARAPPAKA